MAEAQVLRFDRQGRDEARALARMLSVADFRNEARARLPRFVFDYVDGGAEDEECVLRNERDLTALQMVPMCLRDTTKVDAAVEVFGKRWAAPIGIAPMGLAGLIRPQGDIQLARAACDVGLPFILSTASNSRLEAVQASVSGDAIQWMQLYVMSDRRIAEQMVRRAKDAGYQALVLTVDVPVSGSRERDSRNGFKLPFHLTPRIWLDFACHPRWALSMAKAGAPDFVNLSEQEHSSAVQDRAALLSRAMDRSLTWDSLQWLRSLWDGPLLLKGVLHPADAARALRHGIDGIIVSNHGGRQLDVAPSAIASLPPILDTVGGQIPVFVDSGFRRGSDVLKAIALGARAAFVGRPAMWGLAAGGQAGAAAVLRTLCAEMIRGMTLSGVASLAEITPRHVISNSR